MLYKIFFITITFSAINCAPQFVSFKDGKVGVNFGGYHAEAGLGGILTGNAAHGGLSASAGTPFGQNAAAGIGGSSGGRSFGGAYAGATAGGNVGASAGLGGVVSDEITSGGLGAEAHAGGVSHTAIANGGKGVQVTKQVSTVVQPAIEGEIGFYASGGSKASAGVATQAVAEVENIKVPKKYVPQVAQTPVVVEKRKQVVVAPALPPPQPIIVPAPAATVAKSASFAGSAQGSVQAGTLFDSIFNIPIQTLKAVNGLLNTKANVAGGLAGGVAVEKSVGLYG